MAKKQGFSAPDADAEVIEQAFNSDLANAPSDADLVREALRQMVASATTPPAARAQAARTLAEMAGLLGRHSAPPTDQGKPVAEMTRAELEAELLRSKAQHGTPASP